MINYFILFFFLSTTPYLYGAGADYLPVAGVEKIKQSAPPLVMSGINDSEFDLQDFKGKAVLLHFWATWCKPCREEFPLLEKINRTFNKDNMVILPVSVDNDLSISQLSNVARNWGATFPVYVSADKKLSEKYLARGIPVTYFIDKNGAITGRILGPGDWTSDEIEQYIRTLSKDYLH